MLLQTFIIVFIAFSSFAQISNIECNIPGGSINILLDSTKFSRETISIFPGSRLQIGQTDLCMKLPYKP